MALTFAAGIINFAFAASKLEEDEQIDGKEALGITLDAFTTGLSALIPAAIESLPIKNTTILKNVWEIAEKGIAATSDCQENGSDLISWTESLTKEALMDCIKMALKSVFD